MLYVAMGCSWYCESRCKPQLKRESSRNLLFDKQKIDEAMNDYLKNVGPAGSAKTDEEKAEAAFNLLLVHGSKPKVGERQSLRRFMST